MTLLSFYDQSDVSLEASEVRSIYSDVQVIPWKEFSPRGFRARLGFFSLKPRSIIDTFSPEMAQAITRALNTRKYDLVIASQLQMAAYFPYFENIPALFEELEIGLIYGQATASVDKVQRLRHAITWFKLRRYLSHLLAAFQACTVVSDQEQELVKSSFPAYQHDVKVVPNCMNLKDYENIQVESKPNQLIFTGSFRYRANYEAMLWFVGEVLPVILQKKNDVQLVITGDHLDLPLPTSKNITFAGYVDDIKTMIASSAVVIAPLWSGGGTRLKILEAMAIGIPVVATTKGVEGLDAKTGEHLFIADSPALFADSVVRLLSNLDLRQNLVRNATQLVNDKYDWAKVLPKFLDLVVQVATR